MADLVPYVVQPGDHLVKIAFKMGFDAETIWADPKNAALRASRPSMHVLCTGDVLYVPKKPASWAPPSIGSKNVFVTKVPTVHIAVKFAFEGKPLASAKCTIQELPNLGQLTTTSDGTLKFDVPVGTELATVEFSDVDLTQPLRIGHLDPLTEPSGVFQRLCNLGCVLDDPANIGTLDDQAVREPLEDFLSAEGVSDATGDLDDQARAKLKSVYGC